jgi:hypothetical protein
LSWKIQEAVIPAGIAGIQCQGWQRNVDIDDSHSATLHPLQSGFRQSLPE